MRNRVSLLCTAAVSFVAISGPLLSQQPVEQNLRIDWSKTVITSKTTPSLQVVVNPQLLRGAKLHDGSFAALKMLGADYEIGRAHV